MNIVAISGSLRNESSNTAILRFIATLVPENAHFSIYEGLGSLPHFNTDLDGENAPESVANLRQQLTQADAVVICTPEYAQGIPGSLKNALDWLVSSGEFMHKPTAVITASMMGTHAHASLLLTLHMMMATILPETAFVIQAIAQKMDKQTGLITDQATVEQLKTALKALEQAVQTNVA